MKQADEIRRDVSEAYSRAVNAELPPSSSCCGGSHKGVAVQSAGYSKEELGALPAEAVANAFGCGNPLAFGEVRPGDVVVDLGSGAGIDLLIASRKVGPTGRVIGVDMTEDMIAKARENIRAAGLLNVEVRKGIIEALPVDAESVDWVISNCVINLSPEKPRVFREIARVLRPGGRMLVSDIVVESLPDWVRRDARLYSSCVAGAISEVEYLNGLGEAGLVEVEVCARHVYDKGQLRAFLTSELPTGEAGACGCGGADRDLVDKLAPLVEGKIWSAQFHARKAKR